MQVGSIVMCIDDNWNGKDFVYPNVIFPYKDEIYVVREIISFKNGTGVLLEEIDNSNAIIDFKEPFFDIKRFTELQPPMDIAELIEETNLETA